MEPPSECEVPRRRRGLGYSSTDLCSSAPYTTPINVEKGEQVLIYHEEGWRPAEVINKHETPRSYVVATDKGGVLRRNTVHIKKMTNQQQSTEDNPPNQFQTIAERRSKRIIKPPNRLNL